MISDQFSKWYEIYDDPSKDGDFFRPNFRLSQRTFRRLLQIIPTNKNRGWENFFEFMIFIFWIGSGCSYRVGSHAFGIARSTFCDLVHRKLDEIIKVRNQVIRFPDSQDEVIRMARAFKRKSKQGCMDRFVGCLDGSHVRVKCPKGQETSYYDRDHNYSVQMQGLSDDRCKFLNLFVGFPGSCHDSKVLRYSSLYLKKLWPPEGYLIAGDSGYPCISDPIKIITPFKTNMRPLTREEIAYNKAHSRIRITVERAFALLKNRWRSIFDKVLQVKIGRVAKVITAAVILHNVCISCEDNWAIPSFDSRVEVENDLQPQLSQQMIDQESASAIRRQLAQACISLEPPVLP